MHYQEERLHKVSLKFGRQEIKENVDGGYSFKTKGENKH